jgi:hypothetical protein
MHRMSETAARAPAPLPPITVSVKEAKRLSGLGTTTIYKLIKAGRLEKVKVESRTLITYASLSAVLNPQDVTPDKQNHERKPRRKGVAATGH